MKIRVKPIVAMAAGAALLSGALCPTARGALVLSGMATLADSAGTATGPEALTVNYSVNLTSGVYTYSYTVYNPVGDVQLGGSGSPGSGEVVDAFSVGFNTMLPGAYTGSPASAPVPQNDLASGLFWTFTPVAPGDFSPTLSFYSTLPPTLGNANALDANPPSPWSSNPDGQQVPVPVPEPTTLIVGGLLLVPFLRTMKTKAGL
jgi:hypothetical protein